MRNKTKARSQKKKPPQTLKKDSFGSGETKLQVRAQAPQNNFSSTRSNIANYYCTERLTYLFELQPREC